MKNSILIFILGFFTTFAFGQKILTYDEYLANKDRGEVMAANVEGKDTMLLVYVAPITIFPKRKFKSKRERRRYTRLVRKVKKVYPYSVIIQNVFAETELALDTITDKRQRRKMLKTKEKALKEEFEDVIRNMTFSEGRVLIKLVDRQTGKTSYQLVKQLKGNLSAVLWQSVARVFSTSPKYEYDKDGDDKWIEEIVARIENGTL